MTMKRRLPKPLLVIGAPRERRAPRATRPRGPPPQRGAPRPPAAPREGETGSLVHPPAARAERRVSAPCSCHGCRTRGQGTCGGFRCECCGFESLAVLRHDELSNNHYCAPCCVGMRLSAVVEEPTGNDRLGALVMRSGARLNVPSPPTGGQSDALAARRSCAPRRTPRVHRHHVRRLRGDRAAPMHVQNDALGRTLTARSDDGTEGNRHTSQGDGGAKGCPIL